MWGASMRHLLHQGAQNLTTTLPPAAGEYAGFWDGVEKAAWDEGDGQRLAAAAGVGRPAGQQASRQAPSTREPPT